MALPIEEPWPLPFSLLDGCLEVPRLGFGHLLLLLLLLLLRGSSGVVAVRGTRHYPVATVGDVCHSGRRNPDIGVFSDASVDAEGVHLSDKPHPHDVYPESGRGGLRSKH